jgi:AhpD family alkylhydroperoxidase
MAETLEPKTKELVGIAAAVAGHCQPCFAYHYKEALRLGVSEEAIRATMELARAVRQAGDKHMDEFANRRMADTTRKSPQQTKNAGEDT